jgi:hypothetical protein
MLHQCFYSFVFIIAVANTANSQSTCPMTATPGGSCVPGQSCRYSPIGCTDGIKFATSCICKGKLKRGSYKCTTTQVNCAINDLDCPASLGLAAGKTCDPEIVQYCNYDPIGCPGSNDPGIFISRCFCDSTLKSFLCTSYAMAPCN